MNLLNIETIIVKKSKFVAYYYSLENIDEIETILTNITKKEKKATHIVYAYVFDNQQKKYDAKEPAGTAGLPILKILLENNLNKNIIVVARYFGGTKLGVGGLMRAYLNVSKQVIKKP